MFEPPKDYRCGRCKRTTAEGAEFYQRRSRSNGTASHCKVCALHLQAEHYQKSEDRRASIRANAKKQRERIGRYINDYKDAIGCSGCREAHSDQLVFADPETGVLARVSEARNRSIHIAEKLLEGNLPMCHSCLSLARKSGCWPDRPDVRLPRKEDYQVVE